MWRTPEEDEVKGTERRTPEEDEVKGTEWRTNGIKLKEQSGGHWKKTKLKKHSG